MYVDEPIGMDHPLAMIKFQSGVDATLHYQNKMLLKESIESTLKHIRYLFGDDIPDELVRTTVSLVYAENDALKTK
jgi:spore cortex formation protein SpoVR/YcgB (stage V sporulation)